MPEEGYRVVFLGLRDDLPDTEQTFRQNVSKIFRIGGEQIDKIIAKSPVIIRKNLNKAEADSIASKLEMIGGKVNIEPDRSVMIQNQNTIQEEKKKAKFKILINHIESEQSKHGIANYLNKVLDIDYIDIRDRLSEEPPVILPGEFSYEEAGNIRKGLEDFQSRVSIGEIREDDSELPTIHAQGNKKSIAMPAIILLITSLTLVALVSLYKHENTELKTIVNKVENKVPEARGERTENKSHLRLAKEAVRALSELEFRSRFDISYTDYMQELENAESKINLFLESREAQDRFLLSESIRGVMIHYQNAAKLWVYKTRYGRSSVGKTREDVQSYLELYPEINRPLREGGAVDDAGGLSIDAAVSIIMGEASKELKRVSRILERNTPIS